MILFPLFNNRTRIACDILIPAACTSGTLQEDNKSDITEQNLTIFKTPITPFLLGKHETLTGKRPGSTTLTTMRRARGDAPTHIVQIQKQATIYLISSSLTSKINFELAGIPGRAFLPYARLGGIEMRRSPPTAMPATPISQPLMTSPLPSLKVKGLPFLLAVRIRR